MITASLLDQPQELPSAPFVGRQAELAALSPALRDALAGAGRVVLLAGEPGIGKTRLAEELAGYAAQQGASVLWGRCSEWEGAPSYWPWIQMLRVLLDGHGNAALLSRLGDAGADVAQLLPELRASGLELPELPPQDPEQARFRLFDAVTRLLRAAAADKPRVIVLDDLHWADAPSLLLLQFLAEHLGDAPMLVLGSYRNVEVGRQHPLARTLAELTRRPATKRIVLQGLSAADVARYVALVAGHEPSSRLVEALLRETEGNPFFLTEVLRLLMSEGAIEQWSAGAWIPRVPESVREVIGRRLDRLSDTSNAVLNVAAVIGREFSLALLQRVCELDTERLLDALDEATQAHIIEEQGALGQYRFSHALIQETLLDGLSTVRRVHLHAQVGLELEQLHATNPTPVLGELAHHFFQAAPLGQAEKAATYARLAAEQAYGQVAWEDAAAHYERALQALDLVSALGDQQRIELLLALNQAQEYAGNMRGARQSRRQAVPLIRRAGSIEQLAAVAMQHGVGPWGSAFADADIAVLLDEVLAALPAADSELRVRVLGRLAASLHHVPGTRERRIQLTDEATATARRLSDDAAFIFALSSTVQSFFEPEEQERVLQCTRALATIAERINDPLSAGMASYFYGVIAMQHGDLAAYERGLVSYVRLTREGNFLAGRWQLLTIQAGLALLFGRFDEAERLAGEGRHVGEFSSYAEWMPNYEYWSLLFLLRRLQGRLSELEGAVRQLVQDHPDDGYWLCRAALLAADGGRHDEAHELMTRIAVSRFERLTSVNWWQVNLVPLAETCVSLEDREHAVVLIELLTPYADWNIGEITFYYGSGAHYLGILETLLSKWDDAERHFEAALAMNHRLRARPLLARTQWSYADMLVKRGALTDRARALELAGAALTTAEELGMAALASDARILVEQLAPAARAVTGDGHRSAYRLSPRERQVLELLAQGSSDREIGEALFISHRTVTTHVTSILNKLGVDSRTAAATLAVKQQLV